MPTAGDADARDEPGAADPPRSAPDEPVTIRLPVEPDSVRRARRHVAEVLAAWGVDAECRTDAVLLVSEVASNVVQHTRAGSLVVTVEGSARRVTVRVTEHGSAPERGPGSGDRPAVAHPLVPLPDPRPESGRGLRIVEALAVEWGISRTRWSTTTWFALLTSSRSPHGGEPA